LAQFLIVLVREIQQPPLGKLIGLISKTAATRSVLLQKGTVHLRPPDATNALTLHGMTMTLNSFSQIPAHFPDANFPSSATVMADSIRPGCLARIILNGSAIRFLQSPFRHSHSNTRAGQVGYPSKADFYMQVSGRPSRRNFVR
jgi:hypothetical protein